MQDFAYKAEIQWWIYALAAAAAIFIAVVTVSFQAVKAAIGNPVTSLRTE
jgi:putative ABC transport system permease protein